MDVRDIYYHGIRHQVKRVLQAMGEQRVLDGISAFENGQHNWSACFFARAYPDLKLHEQSDPETVLMDKLDLPRTPIRIVWHLFDNFGRGVTMSQKELHEFVRGFLDDQRDPIVQKNIEDLMRSMDFTKAEATPAKLTCEV